MAEEKDKVVRERNINLWKHAEVYTSTKDDPKVATDGTFDPATWDFVGLLNDGAAIGQEPDITRNDVKSFGGVLQLKDNKFNKDVRTFTALEENEVTFSLMWPGSKFVENGKGTIKAPAEDAEVFIAFKTKNSFGDVYIDISRRTASVFASNRDKADTGASTSQFTADVKMDDKGFIYDFLRIKATDEVAEVDAETIRIAANP